MVCNVANRDIYSKKSIVIHHRGIVSLWGMMVKNGGYARVFFPGIGYIESSSYKINRAISGSVQKKKCATKSS